MFIFVASRAVAACLLSAGSELYLYSGPGRLDSGLRALSEAKQAERKQKQTDSGLRFDSRPRARHLRAVRRGDF